MFVLQVNELTYTKMPVFYNWHFCYVKIKFSLAKQDILLYHLHINILTNGGIMQGFNCIMVYSDDGNNLLFCKRTKNPYNGLYNLVGGKIEAGEDGYDAA